MERMTEPASDAVRKSRSAYPDVDVWLADLDHTECRQDGEGRCRTLHCVQCGVAVQTGLVPCENGCNAN